MKKPSLIGLITKPKEQFEAMKSNPAIAWIPLTVLSLLTMVVYVFLDEPSFFTFAGNSGVHIALVGVLALFVFMIMYVFIVLSIMIMSWITQGIVKLFGGNISFKHSFSLNMNLWFISLLGLIGSLLLTFLFRTNPEVHYTSFASMLPVKGFWAGVLSCVDLFEIWFTTLFAMGLATLTNLSPKKSWIIAILFWMISAVCTGLVSTL
ncbi:YIP1 family protein [Thermoactinomyces sp. DSM 45892]|uniref:YIP1 family protein n=1 Tax=Thermoactinomyces sp. DSM 45892 TaxID=1882753 RepID=UPI0008999BAF|nr:YIP1 family protein [Thermoactinomyces sp. DSM 45892]SDX94630.1 Yip1 domain-containing protein [Thermoactinomyces sp. DSM 45892]